MKIEKIELKRLQIPLKHSFETSFGKTNMKDFILATVHSEGEAGHAESVAMSRPIYNEETTDTVWNMAETLLIPVLFQNDIQRPEDVAELFAFVRRNNMAKALLEGAIWDLWSKQQNTSLARALGGSRKQIEVGVSIGIEQTIPELLRKVEAFLSDGYKKIKVKIKPGWDIEPIRAIRKQFGNDFGLMADANSAYRLEDIDIIRQLDQFELLMIEQPLAHDDIIDHAKLQRLLHTPICLDESIITAEDARKAVELGSCKVINIKVGRVGGLTEAKKIHDVCLREGIPVWCGGMLEAGVGRAHNIAIASLENFSIPGDTSESKRYWEEDIVEPPVSFVEPGLLEVPDSPGIGYKLNESIINKYTVQKETYKASS